MPKNSEVGGLPQTLVWSSYLWWNMTNNFSDYTPLRELLRGTRSSRLWRPMGWYSIHLRLDQFASIVFSRHGGIKQPTKVLGPWILSGNFGWCVVAWNSDFIPFPTQPEQEKESTSDFRLALTTKMDLCRYWSISGDLSLFQAHTRVFLVPKRVRKRTFV